MSATLLVSATTFFVSKQYLVDQRERTAIRQTFLNARLVRDLLQAGDEEPQAFSTTLSAKSARSHCYASTANGSRRVSPPIPAICRQIWSRRSTAVTPRISGSGVPASHDSSSEFHCPRSTRQYLEIVPMDGLERTLRTLSLSLVIGSIGTTLAGTLVGVYASRRVLRPVQQMSDVAAGITAGDLHARLDARGDRDLAPAGHFVQRHGRCAARNASNASSGSPPTSAMSCALL